MKFHGNVTGVGNSIQLLLGQIFALGRACSHGDHHHRCLDIDIDHKIMLEYTRYLGEVLQQIFIVFYILKLVPQLLGCVQIFQGLNEDVLG